MAAEIINSILDGPKGVYLVVDASDMKVAFQEFLQIIREAEDEKRAYDDELATVTREEACRISTVHTVPSSAGRRTVIWYL